MLSRLTRNKERPRVLILGGGELGEATEAFYRSDEIELLCMDVYASRYTNLVGDGHSLPFEAQSIDGVWVQAVLEHVLEPHKVVSEIHRVLRPLGLVYVETPFMQQVHEGAYDFTRFTRSGHRWLFRHFEEIESGVVAGAGSAALWAIRYLVRALGLRRTHISVLFFWVHCLDFFAEKNCKCNADAACCLYFFGRRSERPMSQKEIVAYYES
jgi:SAM-dependent methyltransferase